MPNGPPVSRRVTFELQRGSGARHRARL